METISLHILMGFWDIVPRFHDLKTSMMTRTKF